MDLKKVDFNFLLILLLFLGAYFYFDYIALNKIIALVIIGVFIAVCSYVLYGLSFKLWVKAVLLIFISLLAFLLPNFFIEKAHAATIDNRLYGSWITDSTDGYSIKLKVIADSAYLSQTNLSASKAYRLAIANDTLILSNEDLSREYKWKYIFAHQDSSLLLYNHKDSLLFTKVY